MSPAEIRAHALAAVRFAHLTMPRGASNIAQRTVMAAGQSAEPEQLKSLQKQGQLSPQQTQLMDLDSRVNAGRNVLGLILQQLVTEQDKVAAGLLLMKRLAEDTKAGNCHEQAAAAFFYLRNKKVPKVSLVKVWMGRYVQDWHVFVVIGDVVFDQTKVWSLDKKVLVCDPWVADLAVEPQDKTGVYETGYDDLLKGLEVAGPNEQLVEIKTPTDEEWWG